MPRCTRIAFEPAAADGQQNEGKIRPFGLRAEPSGEPVQIGAMERLFGQQAKAGAVLELVFKIAKGSANSAADAGFLEHRGRDLRIPSLRGEDQPTLGQVQCHGFWPSNDGEPSPVKVGTPRRTPWKLVSVSPTVSPLLSITYSRMVFSCALVRFFTTEIARLTRPCASKY